MPLLALISIGGLVLLLAEVAARQWRDPLARDITGDWSLLPTATRQLSPRALRDACRIVVLGDSIPFGWPLSTYDGYPTRLEALLRARYPERALVVINAGIGGHTAVMGLARVDRDLVRWRPQIALIAFGLNDCHLARSNLDIRRERAMYARRRLQGRLRALLWRIALLTLLPRRRRGQGKDLVAPTPEISLPGAAEPRVSPAAYRDALQGLVPAARRAGARPYLLTMTPLGPAALVATPPYPPAWRQDVYQVFDGILRQVALEEQVPLIDAQAAFPAGPALTPFLARDGVHLTALGQQRLAEAIAGCIELEIEQLPAGRGICKFRWPGLS